MQNLFSVKIVGGMTYAILPTILIIVSHGKIQCLIKSSFWH